MKQYVFVCMLAFAMIFPSSCGNPNATGTPEEILSKKAYSSIITKYKNINDFYEGVAIVEANDKKGAINTKGTEIIPCKYGYLGDCSNGMIMFREEPEKYTYKYGYLNTKGEIIVPAIYDTARPFSEGFASVSTKAMNGMGYINTKGELAIPGPYDDCGAFNEGLALVIKGNRSMAIDKKGMAVITLGSSSIFFADSFSEGLIPIISDINGGLKCAYINKSGNEVLPHQYDYAEGFINGTAYAIKDKTIILINKKGEVLEKTTDIDVLNPISVIHEGAMMAAMGLDLYNYDEDEDDEDEDDDDWYDDEEDW